MVKLGEICREDRVLVAPDSPKIECLRYIGMEHIESNSGRIDPNPFAAELTVQSQCFKFDTRHVLYGKLRPYLNKVALPDFCGRCSTELIPLLPDTTVDRAYLAHVLRRPETVKAAMGEKTGSRMPRADMDKLLQLPVPFAPLTEQRRIVAALDAQLAAATSARVAVAAQLEAAPRVDEAVLRELFVSATWPREALGDLARITGGIQKTPDRFPVSFHRPFLTVRNVQRNSLDLSVVERFEVRPDELEKYRLVSGDLLIVEGNGSRDHIGRNALFPDGMPEEWIHQNHIIRVRLNRARLMPEFVSAFLNSDGGRAQMLKKAETTSGLYTLSTAKVASLDVPVPSLAEQANIVRDLQARSAATQRLIAALREKLAALDILPARLLARAFTDPHGQENQEAQLAVVR